MNFDNPYQIIGQANENLLSKACDVIKKLNDDDYNYSDYGIESKNKSWLRLDFLMANTYDGYHGLIFSTIKELVDDVINNFKLDTVKSFSVSMLKPNEILEDHTDSRFVHRLTNRYIIPLIDGGDSYNYWIVDGVRTKHYLKRGQIFRVNNAIIHGAVNSGNIERFNILIDTFNDRLNEKFGKSIDLNAPLSRVGIGWSRDRKSNNKNDRNIMYLIKKMNEDSGLRV